LHKLELCPSGWADRMPDAHSQPPQPDLDGVPFWTVVKRSHIPMALVDGNRLYVGVNDAVVEVFQYPREQIIGRRAGRMLVGADSTSDEDWRRLVDTNELYGESVVVHGNGTHLRVSYAAHATTLEDRWLALFVTLSARFQPSGAELIGPAQFESRNGHEAKLTQREREVVRLVALGSNTRAIAAELHVSPDTIRSHVRNAMAKTGARTRAQLVALVLADGMIGD
jgi:DNA-binding CsgD family transcriptional regulator